MGRDIRLAAVVLAASVLSVVSAGAQATYEGTLVDSKCYLGMGETDNDHGSMKACGTMCLRGGTPAGLLTKDKQFHALIAPSTSLADYVGQQIRVVGSLHNGAILAKSVQVNKGGRWEEVKLGGMAS
ncbi:MAG: hypothetical protein HYU37_04765 [Acidobacteria bacterium]|nr:hypothetical protein [Acidobacteriota bacterium]